MSHRLPPPTHPSTPVGGSPLQPLSGTSPAQQRAGTHWKQPSGERGTERASHWPKVTQRTRRWREAGGMQGDGPRARRVLGHRHGTHSRSCPRAPAPPRTPSGQRPWCAAGPGGTGGAPSKAGDSAWACAELEPGGDAGTAARSRFRVGPRAASYSSGRAGGRAERRGPSASRLPSRPWGAGAGV